MSDLVIKERHGRVLVLTLNRPKKKNAINPAMWDAIRHAFEDADADSGIACMVLTGAGDDFCAGVDLTSFMVSNDDEDPQAGFNQCVRTIAGFSKPWVGAAKGVAVGGGATILFHADVVYVGESLRMRLPFASLGLAPEFASSYMLQANIGAQRAAELFYTAEWIDAVRATETGIAVRAYSDDQLLEAALEKAQEVAKWPVSALREIKTALRMHHAEAIERAFVAEGEAMLRLAGSAENIEAVTAFMEKRDPDFSHLQQP